MKISEIKDNSVLIKDLKIVKYIDITTKEVIIQGFIEGDNTPLLGMLEYILSKNNKGLMYIDRFRYEVNFVANVCKYYGDVEIEADENGQTINVVEDYNFLMENGIYESIYKKASVDIDRFKDLLDKTLEDRLWEINSLNAIISNALNKISEKIPTGKELTKFVNQIDKKVKANPEMFGQLQQTLGMFKQIEK